MDSSYKTFYILKYSMDPNVVGRDLSQLALTGPRPKPVRPSKDKRFPDYNIPLTFQLHHNAKWTDIMRQPSLGGSSLTISTKAMKILENFTLGPHRFYPATFVEEKGNTKQEGFWLSLDRLIGLELIDYSRSSFVAKSMVNGTITNQMVISSPSHFKEVNASLDRPFSLQGKEIHFLPTIELDLFTLFPTKSTYVSSNLAYSIRSSNLTGYELKDM